jgi:hypothetical protein
LPGVLCLLRMGKVFMDPTVLTSTTQYTAYKLQVHNVCPNCLSSHLVTNNRNLCLTETLKKLVSHNKIVWANFTGKCKI